MMPEEDLVEAAADCPPCGPKLRNKPAESFTDRDSKSSDGSDKDEDLAKAIEGLNLKEKPTKPAVSEDKTAHNKPAEAKPPEKGATQKRQGAEASELRGATCAPSPREVVTKLRSRSGDDLGISRPSLRQHGRSESELWVCNERGTGLESETGKIYHWQNERPRALRDGDRYFNVEQRLFNNPYAAGRQNPLFMRPPQPPLQPPLGATPSGHNGRRRRLSPPARTEVPDYTFTHADFEQNIDMNIVFGDSTYKIRRNNILHKFALLLDLKNFKRALCYMRINGLVHALNAQNELSQTPLIIWAYLDHKEGVRATMFAEPDPNIRGTHVLPGSNGQALRSRLQSPVSIIALSKKPDFLMTFLKLARVNASDKPHLRVQLDQLDGVERKQRSSGWTALAQVVHSGDSELILNAKTLISEGSNPFFKMRNDYYDQIDPMTIALKKRESLKFVKPMIETLMTKNAEDVKQLNYIISAQFAHEDAPFKGTYLDIFLHGSKLRADRYSPNFRERDAEEAKDILKRVGARTASDQADEELFNIFPTPPQSQAAQSEYSTSSPSYFSPHSSSLSPTHSQSVSPPLQFEEQFPEALSPPQQPQPRQPRELLVYDGETHVTCQVTERDKRTLNELCDLDAIFDPDPDCYLTDPKYGSTSLPPPNRM